MPPRASTPLVLLGRVHPLWWVPAALAFLSVDHLSGYALPPPTYVPLIVGAAWYSGLRTGVAMSILLPLVRLAVGGWHDPLMTPLRLVISIGVLIFMAVISGRLSQHERAMQARIEALERLLPMCMFCKSIRRDDQTWSALEHYMSESGTQVTHGICPTCAHKEGWHGLE